MTEILLGSAVFTLLVMVLALIVLGARAVLMPRGLAQVTVNGDQTIEGRMGDKLLAVLETGGIHLPTTCGGAGTCGLCRVTIADAPDALSTEKAKLEAAEVAAGLRLACQTVLRGDMKVTVDDQYLAAELWQCVVASTHGVSPLIKEIRLTLPEGAARSIPAGSYVRVEAPPFRLDYGEIQVEPEHHEAWDHMGISTLVAESKVPVNRAYSLVNHPGETKELILNIRLALPPRGRTDIPPGIVSSWLFGLKAGDPVTVNGPFGNFFIKDTDREIILIGGGVGMAPLRAHVFDQLEQARTGRRISYWYGARGLIDLYYDDDMKRLEAEHENFSWHVALSDPGADGCWTGPRGFIHDVVYEQYLKDHPDPAACEYYLCGPPVMIQAVLAMLARLGVERDDIHFDDFGG